MDGTFEDGRPAWLGRLGRVRNVVRQELIGRQLDHHLGTAPRTVLDVGAGQGTQSLRLARAGHAVTAVEPDAEMRESFAAALAEEPADVRDRVILRAGTVDDLATSERFDAVLLMGVLMYVPDSRAAVAALTGHVAPGGLLAMAVRTTTSALWRPAARQDWFAAREAIAEDARARAAGRDVDYVNEIGAPARAQDFEALLAVGAADGLVLEDWYGIRIAVDSEEEDPPPPSDPEELAALLEVENYLSAHDPYRQLGQLAHLVLRRPDGELSPVDG